MKGMFFSSAKVDETWDLLLGQMQYVNCAARTITVYVLNKYATFYMYVRYALINYAAKVDARYALVNLTARTDESYLLVNYVASVYAR